MDNMRITLALGPFLPIPPVAGGAVERFMWNLALAFSERSHDVTIMTRRWTGMPNDQRVGDINIVRVRSKDRPSSKALGYLYDLIYSVKVANAAPDADVIVTNTFFLPLVLPPVRKGAVYVHVARMPRRQMGLYRRASRFHAVSDQVRQALVVQSPGLRAKVFVVPNALPPAFRGLQPSQNVERPRLVLYVGRIAREKGIELLIQGFAKAKLADWQLVLMGPSESAAGGDGEEYRQTLAALASSLGIRFEFRPPSYDVSALVAIYSEAPIFVYPSVADGESFGMAPLEAMACGCAVIISDLPCFCEFARPGENCLSFDHRGDDPPAALAAALTTLVTDHEKAQVLANAGIAEASRFGIDVVADALLADFSRVVAVGGGESRGP